MSITVPLEGFGGGSDPLNFKVVGGTVQPENPKENTIWVNTDTEITGWIFSVTEPEALSEGMVWILTGAASPTEFDALKRNGIQVYPRTVKQYVDDALVSKDAKIYQDGAWADIAGYLYNLGNEFEAITGGWQARAWPNNSAVTAVTPTLTKNADNMTISHSKAASGKYSASGAVDLKKNLDVTSVDTIVFSFERVTVGGTVSSDGQNPTVYVGIADRNATYVAASALARQSLSLTAVGTKENVILEVDVSEIQGAYDVFISFQLYRENAAQSITLVCTSVELK